MYAAVLASGSRTLPFSIGTDQPRVWFGLPRAFDRFSHLHWGVLAHSTHLRGAGTYDAERGELCRVRVTLATGIPPDVVRAVNLGYLDPGGVDLAAFAADGETLVVPQAGEVLFRLG